MEASETTTSSAFAKPPWLFKGSALYQFHLVKAATARAYIPKELRLVEAFGYTLGGFFLAHYDDSPFGMFDELVVIAGIVWNKPTSCAWAARVLVNNQKACLHGRKDVGLPSHVAGFSKTISAITEKPTKKRNDFLNMIGLGSTSITTKNMNVTEANGSHEAEFCNIKLTTSVSQESSSGKSWMGPVVKMSLPSFSGRTEYHPELLRYSCQINCRVRPVNCAEVSVKDGEDESREKCVSVLLSKPILALQFNCLRMQVEAPTLVDNL